jgi:heme-degrading monooxygenase HmoA
MVTETPYYAVIFTSKRTQVDNGYDETSLKMENLARQQPGFLGMDSVKNEVGITVSYWDSLDAISNWKQNLDHQVAQNKGKDKWYSSYHVRICRVEREYSFKK